MRLAILTTALALAGGGPAGAWPAPRSAPFRRPPRAAHLARLPAVVESASETAPS